MSLFVYNSGECEVLVRDDFLNKLGQNQDVIYCDEVQKRDCYGVRALHAEQFVLEVVVDIGAQIGTLSMMVAKYWPKARIFCYEPVSAQCRVLRRNVPNAMCRETAVIGFYGKEAGNDVHKCVYHVHDPELPYRERKGVAVSVEEMFANDNICSIDFLKLDCEECEVNIIRELAMLGKLKDIKRIHGEWHGPAARHEVIETLAITHDVDLPIRHPEQKGGVWFARLRT